MVSGCAGEELLESIDVRIPACVDKAENTIHAASHSPWDALFINKFFVCISRNLSERDKTIGERRFFINR